MNTKLIAMALAVSMLGLGGVAEARTAGHRGGAHHAARHVGHVRHAGRRVGHRYYAARPHRNHFAYRTHRIHRYPRRFNHSYVYNRNVWPTNSYNTFVRRPQLTPGATMLRNNTITVPATVTLPRSAV